MDMRMIFQIRSPCVKYLYDSGNSTDIFFVACEFNDRLGHTLMQQCIEILLVFINQVVKFVRHCKYRMLIRRVNHFTLPLIYPDSLVDGLALRTVAVAA